MNDQGVLFNIDWTLAVDGDTKLPPKQAKIEKNVILSQNLEV